MLKENFEYYKAHQDELVKLYNGKFLIIVDQKVVGVYEDRADAYYSALEKYEAGTFTLQLCMPGDIAYSLRFYNRVSPVTLSAK